MRYLIFLLFIFYSAEGCASYEGKWINKHVQSGSVNYDLVLTENGIERRITKSFNMKESDVNDSFLTKVLESEIEIEHERKLEEEQRIKYEIIKREVELDFKDDIQLEIEKRLNEEINS